MKNHIGKTISYPEFVDINNIEEKTDDENKYRFSLKIPFLNHGDINNYIVVIMKNPSGASRFVCDMTIRKVCAVACGNGYGGVVVVNLFPVRATQAEDVQYFYASADYDKYMNDNMREIKALVTNRDVVLAWGRDTIHGRKQFPLNFDSAVKNMIKTVKEANCNIYFADICKCADNTCNAEKRGQNCGGICYPLHGLRWSNNSTLIKY